MMKTTVEIPDDLFRQAKAQAALRGIRLRELVELWLASGACHTAIAAEWPPHSFPTDQRLRRGASTYRHPSCRGAERHG